MSCGFAAAKDNYGFIDINTVMSKYTVAASYTNNVKQKQNEIERLLADANKKIAAAKDDATKKTIEANAKKQIQPKLDAMSNYQKQQGVKVQNNINQAISKVAKTYNYALILNGNAVAFGAVNVTDLVVKELNTNFK